MSEDIGIDGGKVRAVPTTVTAEQINKGIHPPYAVETEAGLVPGPGTTEAVFLDRLEQAQQKKAAGWVRKIFGIEKPLFSQDDSGAYQLSEWFTKHIGRVNELDVEEFLRWLPQRNKALANAVQLDSNSSFTGFMPLMICDEDGSFPENYQHNPALILGSTFRTRLENIRTQFDAFVATEILLALRDWRKEQEKQLEAENYKDYITSYWAYRSSF